MASLQMAEAFIGDGPDRKERYNEFVEIARTGLVPQIS